MFKGLLGTWVLDVQVDREQIPVAVLLDDIASLDLPRPAAGFALLPPGQAVSELLELEGLGLAVVLPPLEQRDV
ncbi:MAG: hypothetical protein ABSG68_18345 [Thermoguttaceae bacterium]|jgi:hypothetical protein